MLVEPRAERSRRAWRREQRVERGDAAPRELIGSERRGRRAAARVERTEPDAGDKQRRDMRSASPLPGGGPSSALPHRAASSQRSVFFSLSGKLWQYPNRTVKTAAWVTFEGEKSSSRRLPA